MHRGSYTVFFLFSITPAPKKVIRPLFSSPSVCGVIESTREQELKSSDKRIFFYSSWSEIFSTVGVFVWDGRCFCELSRNCFVIQRTRDGIKKLKKGADKVEKTHILWASQTGAVWARPGNLLPGYEMVEVLPGILPPKKYISPARCNVFFF